MQDFYKKKNKTGRTMQSQNEWDDSKLKVGMR